MRKINDNNENPWYNISGLNLAYLIDLYEQYREGRTEIDEELRSLFDQWGSPLNEKINRSCIDLHGNDEGLKVVAATKLADHIRNYGHLYADLCPIDSHSTNKKQLQLEDFHLTKTDLEKMSAQIICSCEGVNLENAYEAFLYLKQCYTKTVGIEFSHVHNKEEREWLIDKIEQGRLYQSFTKDKKINLLKSLTEVEEFENFIQRTFVGQKRFSVEGLDALVPMLQNVIQKASLDGVKNVMIGMAHRGRLNVLAHVLGKPYEQIFSEFQQAPNKELVPSEGSTGINFGWTGDVKYHLGADLQLKQKKAMVTLANNPSHLEFVGPIVQGFTRAVQDYRSTRGYPEQDTSKALSLIIHGDAAFAGQGIVAETLNLSGLKGYKVGGSIHIIANNLIGFTTDSIDSRSTTYASDLAKGFEIPIIHVNADDPEACISVMQLAYEYRQAFKRDFIIDLIGYRRYGHNEMDEPAITQPKMYEFIRKHSTVKTLYKEMLTKNGVITDDIEFEKKVKQKLQEGYEKVKNGASLSENEVVENKNESLSQKSETNVPIETLRQINQQLLKWPNEFSIFPKLEKILKRRKASFEEGGKVDWAHAEVLAFATILNDGTPIRLTGQDSERGTFAQRHLVLNDYLHGTRFSPLHQLNTSNVSFAIHNSPLSEAAVVGFEYGYNVIAEKTLVLWEAQYGDFANGAQVLFDQFVSSGRAKWRQKSGIVFLLPHGYEGQGPEHSSARIERFLQLAAENNWTVANLTNSAQYFHILRKQAAMLGRDNVRPLVLMTPKSLLRHRLTASSPLQLAEGSFEPLIQQKVLNHPEEVTRLVLCSGKIAVDLKEALTDEKQPLDELHIMSVEQLYPFPKENIIEIISRFPSLQEIVWVQEEPKNMGAWFYINLKIRSVVPKNVSVRYIGRPNRSSPAEGDPTAHKLEQKRIITEALKFKKGGMNDE